MRSAGAGMDAQRAALDVAARNVAAAEATSDSGAFQRLVPQYSIATMPQTDEGPGDYEPPDELDDPDARDAVPVRYLGARAEPGAEVDAVTEMVAVLDAQRAYEANASVFDVGKRLAERTIDMGRVQ